MAAVRTIAILAPPGVQLLDVSGPLDVFAEANVQTGKIVYRPLVVGTEAAPIRSSSGVRLMPDAVMGALHDEKIHTLLVAGCPDIADTAADPAMVAWLRDVTASARRYGSVCSGAFLLAAAGLLDGCRVTTHWAVAGRLAERYPSVIVDEDAIYLRDGRLRTAAGVTAGLDLALALVEEDMGRDITMKVASQLVMFFKRPGGQRQFSRKGEAAPAGVRPYRSFSVGLSPIPPRPIMSLLSRSGRTSVRAISRACFAARSAPRRQRGLKAYALMQCGKCLNPVASRQSRSR